MDERASEDVLAKRIGFRSINLSGAGRDRACFRFHFVEI